MYAGTVVVTSKILNPGILFRPFEFDTDHPFVVKAAIASVDGHEITSTVELDNAPTAHDVEDTALEIHGKAMLRLACLHNLVIETTKSTIQTIKSKVDPGSCIVLARGVVATAAVGTPSVIVERRPDELRATLEQRHPRSDFYFEMFNQARTSSNTVVEFLGYYQIVSSVLASFSDGTEPEQKDIDRFFLAHDDSIPPPTQKPHKKPGKQSNATETVYTKLRNEIVHIRYAHGMTLVNLEDSKAGISKHVSGLRRLAVIAIQQLLVGKPV